MAGRAVSLSLGRNRDAEVVSDGAEAAVGSSVWRTVSKKRADMAVNVEKV